MLLQEIEINRKLKIEVKNIKKKNCIGLLLYGQSKYLSIEYIIIIWTKYNPNEILEIKVMILHIATFLISIPINTLNKNIDEINIIGDWYFNKKFISLEYAIYWNHTLILKKTIKKYMYLNFPMFFILFIK